jgi:hypothetical protein
VIRRLPYLVLIGGLALPVHVSAETARVVSGEHGRFTRLVVELAEASDWTVGRTAMGYGFAVRADMQPSYDLARVWDRIARDRLQALRTDPESGALMLTLGCDCHVFPFEYQPGTVVLDIRDGPAPPGSSFELTFPAVSLSPPMPLPMGRPPLVPADPAYDWVRSDLRARPDDGESKLPLPLDPTFPSLGPLRDELLRQVSRGAADGVVDMALPDRGQASRSEGMGDLSGAIIRIGALPGLEIAGTQSGDRPETASCIADAEIDVADWGAGRPPLDLLAEARDGLFEEFDAPSPRALGRAVRLHLYLGFGAEAAQYARLMPGPANDPEGAPLVSLARLVDGDPDPASPFLSMLGCGGAAALWGALAHAHLPAGAEIDTDAIVRSFQALPPHLRRHLGPRLSTLLIGDHPEAARIVRDAIERTPDLPPGTVALLDADAALRALRPEAARSHAETAVAEAGAELPGLVALVEAHLQSGIPLSPAVAESLRSLRDVSDAETGRRDRALLLALALSGQFDAAFAMARPEQPEITDLWRVLAQLGDDDALLAQAVLPASEPAPAVAEEVALAIAGRLSGLGFPEQALVWLVPVGPESSDQRRLAAATAQLASGNARVALELLAALSDPAAQEVRVAAYRQLGALDQAREILAAAGKKEDGSRLASWDGNWDVLRLDGAKVWADAAALVGPAALPEAGPLAEGRAALEDSAAARGAITALLAEIPPAAP